MISKLLGALVLIAAASAVQAQGVISPVANPSASAEAETAPAANPAPVPTQAVMANINPFKPATAQAPSTEAPSPEDLPPPPPPVDPVIEAIATELREIREKGERIGVIDGKIIYRHQGRYLVEALPAEGEVYSPERIMLHPSLTDECVIRVVPSNSTSPAASSAASSAGPTQTR